MEGGYECFENGRQVGHQELLDASGALDEADSSASTSMFVSSCKFEPIAIFTGFANCQENGGQRLRLGKLTGLDADERGPWRGGSQVGAGPGIQHRLRGRGAPRKDLQHGDRSLSLHWAGYGL